jgi:hypothetical protein
MFSNAHINKLACGLFDRRKIPARNMGLKPLFLIRGIATPIYTANIPILTGSPRIIG